jgi:hypothetical protein
MDAAMEKLARQVRSGLAKPGIRYDLVLFHLLRSRLTGVHGNRLWPEVAKALSSADSPAIDADWAGIFFRRQLKRHYAKRLAQMWQQKKYLCLAFEESGAGFNRAHFIQEFLEQLVRSLDNPYQPHGSEFLQGLVDEYVARDASSLAPLHSILLSTAEVLVRVRLAVAEAGRVFESRFWTFEQLREFALRETGLDPANVLPEAQALFVHAFRYGEKRLLTQRELFELMLGGAYEIDVPGPVPHAPLAVPLGPAEIAVPGRESTRVEICGPGGETVAQLVRCEQRAPVQFGSGMFTLILDTDLETREIDLDESVRLYEGTSSEAAQLVGVLVARQDVTVHRGTPHLDLEFEWHWTGALVLAINGFHAPLDQGTVKFRLHVDGAEVSAGVMIGGRPTSFRGLRLDSEVAHGSGAERKVVLWTGDERVAETRLSVPGLRHGFVVLDGVAHPLVRNAAPLALSKAPVSVTVFASAQSMRTLSVTGGGISDEIAPDAEEVRVDWPEGKRELAIFIGDREFRARRDLVGHLVLRGESQVELSGLSIRCDRNAAIVREGSGIILAWTGDPYGPDRLFVGDGSGYEWRIDSSLLLGADAINTDLLANLARIGIERPGIYTISHSAQNRMSAVILVVAPHSWRSDCNPLQTGATIHWSGGDGRLGARIASDAPTAWVAGPPSHLASTRHTLVTNLGEVTVSWTPCIEDCLLLVAGRPWWSEIGIATLGLGDARFKFLSRDEVVRGTGTSGAQSLDIANGAALADVLLRLREAKVPSKGALSVSFPGAKSPVRTWQIDLRSEFGDCDAALARHGSACTVSCKGSWSGWAEDAILGSLEADGQALASWAGTRTSTRGGGYEHDFVLTGELPINVLGDAQTVTLRLVLNGEHPRRLVLESASELSVDAPDLSLTPEDLLRQVLKAARTLNPRVLMEKVFDITLSYATTHRRLPLDAARVRRAIEDTSACQPVGFVLDRVEAIVRGRKPAAVENIPEWLAPPADAVLLCMEILNEISKRPSGLMDPSRMERLLALKVGEVTDDLMLAMDAGARVMVGDKLKCEPGSPRLTRLRERYGFIPEAMVGFDEAGG